MSVIPGHDHLIDRFVSQELQPLFSQHQTLAAKSIQRKVGALRAGVEATLRSRLTRADRRKRRGDDELHAIELELRKAAGAFGEVRSHCESLFDSSHTLLDEVLRAAAEAATATLKRTGDRAEAARVARETILLQGSQRAEDARRLLIALATDASQTLQQAARAFQFPEPAADENWARFAREMPQLDLGGLHIDLGLPLLTMFGGRVARARIEAALRARIGDQVAEALRSHGALLQIWANRVLTQFCQQFDARAQVYNNQLVQSADGTAAPEGDLGAVSRDLQEISTGVEASG